MRTKSAPHADTPPVRLIESFRSHFGRDPRFAVRAPGRVDLLGAHVDYNDGFVLPLAVTRDIWVVAAEPLSAERESTTVLATDLGESATLTADAAAGRLPQWARYAAGVAWALGDAGLTTPRLEIAFAGEVPMGAGISSSAALEVAFALAWKHAGGWETERFELAALCRRAENDYVGVACGIMDQFASALGRRDHGLLLDCRSLRWESVRLPSDTALVIADTSTRRQLSDGALNRRYDECMRAAEIARRHGGSAIAALRDLDAQALDAIEQHIPEPERSRARHIVEDCARVLAAAEAMRADDAAGLGELMNRSMRSAQTLYECSGPELDAMWSAGVEHESCLGGRCVGAGFAGCVLFLVRAAAVEPFIEATARRFQAATGLRPRLYEVRAADGAEVVPL
jgi:galactokinase